MEDIKSLSKELDQRQQKSRFLQIIEKICVVIVAGLVFYFGGKLILGLLIDAREGKSKSERVDLLVKQAYRQGQIDCQLGKIKYKMRLDTSWVEIK